MSSLMMVLYLQRVVWKSQGRVVLLFIPPLRMYGYCIRCGSRRGRKFKRLVRLAVVSFVMVLCLTMSALAYEL
jgi:hypothetical protein